MMALFFDAAGVVEVPSRMGRRGSVAGSADSHREKFEPGEIYTHA